MLLIGFIADSPDTRSRRKSTEATIERPVDQRGVIARRDWSCPGPNNRRRASNVDKCAAVTARIIEHLDTGVAPWMRPCTAIGSSDVPINVVTWRIHRGANAINLWMAQTALIDLGAARKGDASVATAPFYSPAVAPTVARYVNKAARLKPSSATETFESTRRGLPE